MAGILDFLPAIGGIFDSFTDKNRYDAAAGMTKEQLDFQKELINKSSGWQDTSNQDILDYILGQNPQQEAETGALNEGQFDFADYINNLRSDFAGGVNDQLDEGATGARKLSGSNLLNQEDIANQQAGAGDDILSIAMGRDPSAFIKSSERLAGDISSDPYDLESMMADAIQSVQMENDRVYGKQMDAVSRDAVRSGTDASGALRDLSSDAARSGVEATLKARLGTPGAYESTLATRQGRLGGAMTALEGAAGGIDNRAMAGLRSGTDALGAAGSTLSDASKLGISTLLHKPDYEDPSAGMSNAYDKFKSVIGSRTNPYAALTNPYSGAKPAIPAMPRNDGSDLGSTLSTALWAALGGGQK